jgi:preprotein translocase subunit SecG
MQTLVIVIHLMIVIAMIGFVLLQKSEGGGLIGSTGGFLTSRGSANVLTRSTAILAGAFFLTSLILSILAGLNRHPASILQPAGGTPQAPASGTPAAPPGGGQSGPGGGLLDQLRQQEQAPAGPLVPQSK